MTIRSNEHRIWYFRMDSEARVRVRVWGNGSQKWGEHNVITKSGSP